MYQRHQDTLLLEEAYKATQLKQHLPNLTVEQVQLVIENASSTELDIIEEFLGGLKNIAGALKQDAKRVGRGIKDTASRAGQAVSDTARRGVEAAKGAKDAAVGVAKGAGSAVKAGAAQAKSNWKNISATGESSAQAEKRKQQLINHVAQLEELYADHLKASPHSRLGAAKTPLNKLTIGKLKLALGQTASVQQRAAATARQGGVFGGAGRQMQAGYEKARKEQKAKAETQAGASDPARYAGPATA